LVIFQILEDSCLALSDLVLLQRYFNSDLNPLDLEISQTKTTSLFSTVSTTDKVSADGGQNKFENSTGNVMFSQSPVSDMLSNRDSNVSSRPDNEGERTGVSFSGIFGSDKMVDGTGSAKQPRAVLQSEMVVASDFDKFLISVEMGKKDTEKSNFADPDKVILKAKSDILLENKNDIENEKSTSCYKGVYKFA
jgi:hypothetical protein